MKALTLAALLFALPALAAEWGMAELETAQKESIVAFENNGGNVRSVTGYSIKLTSQGNAARAEVYFKDQFGQSQKEKFFCHVHGADIDCH